LSSFRLEKEMIYLQINLIFDAHHKQQTALKKKRYKKTHFPFTICEFSLHT